MKLQRISTIAFAVFSPILVEASLYAQSLKIVKLQPPAYPPLALAARVSGDVNLKVFLLDNGTTGDVQVEGGPPMLQQAAIISVKGSMFEFDKDNRVGHPYKLTYKYILKPLDCDQAFDNSYPRFEYDSDTVTVIGQVIPLCDPGAEIRVRSVRCLYLWRCRLK